MGRETRKNTSEPGRKKQRLRMKILYMPVPNFSVSGDQKRRNGNDVFFGLLEGCDLQDRKKSEKNADGFEHGLQTSVRV